MIRVFALHLERNWHSRYRSGLFGELPSLPLSNSRRFTAPRGVPRSDGVCGRMSSTLMRAIGIGLFPWLLLGCVTLRTSQAPPAVQPMDQRQEAGGVTPLAPAPFSHAPGPGDLSGMLDGPTLRIALHDLAIVLDTVGRLETFGPELRSQMLTELAQADAATVTAVVKKWQGRIAELQDQEGELRRPTDLVQAAAMPADPPRVATPPAPPPVLDPMPDGFE